LGSLLWPDLVEQEMDMFLGWGFLPVRRVLELMEVQIIKKFGCHSP